MARIRQFKPSFFTDDKVGRLSRDARLFFFGVLSEADDEGRLVDAPKRLAGTVFPFDDDVTAKKVERWIDELVTQKMVVRYQVDGGRFLLVRKFKEHQKMSHPAKSTLPAPPEPPEPSSGNPPEPRQSGDGAPPAEHPPVFEGVFEGVSVVEGVGVAEPAAVPPSPPADKPPPKRASIPDAFEVTDDLRRWAAENAPSVDLERETARWLDYCRANGKKYLDHHAAWRNWVSRAVDYSPRRPANGAQPNPAVSALDEWRRRADEAEARAQA